MSTYPDYPISVKGFNIKTDDGTKIIRALDGTAWAYRHYPTLRYTFTIVHPSMTSDEEMQLRAFYNNHKGEYIDFSDPRTKRLYSVLMIGPPQYAGIRSGLHMDVKMILTGIEK